MQPVAAAPTHSAHVVSATDLDIWGPSADAGAAPAGDWDPFNNGGVSDGVYIPS